MKCPTDGATLVMSERAGVEIDYCPTCRGIWLDRGELDKIIDRASAELGAEPEPWGRGDAEPGYQPRYDPYPHAGYDDRRPPPRRGRKEHWLFELFD